MAVRGSWVPQDLPPVSVQHGGDWSQGQPKHAPILPTHAPNLLEHAPILPPLHVGVEYEGTSRATFPGCEPTRDPLTIIIPIATSTTYAVIMMPIRPINVYLDIIHVRSLPSGAVAFHVVLDQIHSIAYLIGVKFSSIQSIAVNENRVRESREEDDGRERQTRLKVAHRKDLAVDLAVGVVDGVCGLLHLPHGVLDGVTVVLHFLLHRRWSFRYIVEQRFEARWYIEAYAKTKDANRVLLEAAILDFNIVQSTLQRDLQEIELRKAFTDVTCFITIIDDVYDVYGTLDELHLFTAAVESPIFHEKVAPYAASYEGANFDPLGLKLISVERPFAEKHYEDLSAKPFFNVEL
ncbi:tricyclene synthase TPS4, chloroplastic-like [Senna tora]|uniref:Tricyclene synthase TPS4, chloroplastic-like n=1 Tax=Senna tora TaxID=362788 RepID=A0A834SUF9_9FABA|nr:tricyclene synthase TPS4, chloroplastic-like [Senna tora]